MSIETLEEGNPVDMSNLHTDIKGLRGVLVKGLVIAVCALGGTLVTGLYTYITIDKRMALVEQDLSRGERYTKDEALASTSRQSVINKKTQDEIAVLRNAANSQTVLITIISSDIKYMNKQLDDLIKQGESK